MLTELKRECFEANRELPRHGLVHLSFGNVSVIDRARAIVAIKPSGVSYDALDAKSIVLVDLEGSRVEPGALRPSSDTPTHVALYRGFSQVGGIVHTHSTAATAFAQAGIAIPCLGTTHADYLAGPVPVTRAMTANEIAKDYERETGRVILECFAELDPLRQPMVLVRSHGPFAWGGSGAKAVENAVALEWIAELAYRTLRIAPGLVPIDDALHRKHFERKHGDAAYYGQPAE